MIASTLRRPQTKRVAVSAKRPERSGPEPKPGFNPVWFQLATRAQAKLAISEPGDTYEQEADRVAGQVMRMPAAASPSLSFRSPGSASLQQKCACGGESEGECAECRINRLALQREATGEDARSDAPSIVEDVLASPGQPLASSVRRTLEPSFGQDFSQVRVHDDSKAAQSASALNALAYTVGSHIVFGDGQYAPGTNEGNRLLAHELTHVVQQGTDGPTAGAR